MRLLFAYQFLTYGGVEMVLRNRVRAFRRLVRDRVHVTTMFLSDLGGPRDTLGDELVIAPTRDEIARHLSRADVVSIIDTPQLLDAVGACGKPVVLEAHSPYEHGTDYLRGPLPANTRLVVTPSHAFKLTAERMLARRDIPVVSVHNPIDDDFFASAAPLAGLSLRARPVLWVGRLDDLKNWRAAARAFRKLLQISGDQALELFVVGHRPDPREAFAFWKSERLLGHVRYLPFVAFRSMPALYAAVAAKRGVYLSTSTAESFGMSVVEAMAAGLPCVLTDLPVLLEVSDGRATYFADEDEAARGLERLLNDDAQYDAASRDLARVARRYRPDEVAPLFLNVVEPLVSSPEPLFRAST